MAPASTQSNTTDRFLTTLIEFVEQAPQEEASWNAAGLGITVGAAECMDSDFTLDQANLDVLIEATVSVERSSQRESMVNQTEDNTTYAALQSSQGESMASNAEGKEVEERAEAEAQPNPSSRQWTDDEVRHLTVLCEFTKITMAEVTTVLNRRFDLSLSEEEVIQQWVKMHQEGIPLCKVNWDDITPEEIAIVTRKRL